ncbi:MAG: hypothetical protein KAU14_05620, partial [Thermoplasmata archaeon]|nr:hypothetical protein [Thermoplasmata archaeon]
MTKIRELGAAILFLGIFFLLLISLSVRAEDAFEENDDMGSAAQIDPGVYADLNSSDPDWYLVNCTNTGILRVTVWYPAFAGRVGLFLYSLNGTPLNSSDLGIGEESVETRVQEGKEYYIEVRNNTNTEYHMAVVNGNEESWVFSVYMDGDNTLNDNMEPDLEEMREVGSGNGLYIPVLKDGNGNGDSEVLIVMARGDIRLPLYAVNQSWANELNMGSPSTLSDWLRWCVRTFDTDGRTALDLWDHGKGVWGCCWDSHSGNDLLTLAEIREALDRSGAGYLELLGSDACRMQVLELSCEVKGIVGYLIASEEDEPKAGWDYAPFLSGLSNNLNWTGEGLGRSIVDSYFLEYGTNGEETLSVVKVGEIEGVLDALKGLTSELSNHTALWADEVRAARSKSRDYSSYLADIKDFAMKLRDRTDNETLRLLAQAVADRTKQAVVYENHGCKSPGSHGLSFYFPEGNYKQEYDDITFPT